MDRSQPETSALTTEFGPFNSLASVVTRRSLSTSVYVRSVLLCISVRILRQFLLGLKSCVTNKRNLHRSHTLTRGIVVYTGPGKLMVHADENVQ